MHSRMRQDVLIVDVPEDQTAQILWRVAAEQKQQIRHLKPRRGTLEEVFLEAVEKK